MRQSRPRRDPNQPWLIAAGALALLGGVVLRWGLGLTWLWTVIGGVSASTFVIYGLDKSAAKRGASRVPEAVLHALAALGGSPGALAGQLAFRHKTSKATFQMVFWAIVVAQVGVGWLIWSG